MSAMSPTAFCLVVPDLLYVCMKAGTVRGTASWNFGVGRFGDSPQ
jgi:hypothetical protein